jgi:integrase
MGRVMAVYKRGARASLRLPADFVIHSLRRTMLTRLGEAGADASTMMRIAGHSSDIKRKGP